MKSMRIVVIALLALLATGCRADPKTFFEQWTAAAANKDAETIYALLDKDSRARLLAHIQKSQEKAKKDPAFKRMFTSIGKSMTGLDPSVAPADDLAVALVKHQLDKGYGGGRMGGVSLVEARKISDNTAEVIAQLPAPNGKTARGTAQLRWEDKRWRAVAEPVGFQDAGNTAVSLWIGLPFYEGYEAPSEGDPEKTTITLTREMRLKNGGDVSALSKAERDKAILDGRLVPADGPPTSYDVEVKWQGRSTDAIRVEYTRAAAKITGAQFEGDWGAKRVGYQTHLAALMNHFVEYASESYPGSPLQSVQSATFSVDRAGAVVPKITGFDPRILRIESQELPKLIFGPLPQSLQ